MELSRFRNVILQCLVFLKNKNWVWIQFWKWRVNIWAWNFSAVWILSFLCSVGLLFGELIFSAVMKYAMQSSVQLRKLLLSTWLAWSNHYFKYECNFLLAVLKVEEAKSVSKVTCTCQWRWLTCICLWRSTEQPKSIVIRDLKPAEPGSITCCCR